MILIAVICRNIIVMLRVFTFLNIRVKIILSCQASHLIDYFSILRFLLSNAAEVSKQGTNQLCYQNQSHYIL
jgi:hypothetical protein